MTGPPVVATPAGDLGQLDGVEPRTAAADDLHERPATDGPAEALPQDGTRLPRCANAATAAETPRR